MKAVFSFLAFLVVATFLILIGGWVIDTNFLIFDVILYLGFIALKVVFWLLIVILVIWLIKELFD